VSNTVARLPPGERSDSGRTGVALPALNPPTTYPGARSPAPPGVTELSPDDGDDDDDDDDDDDNGAPPSPLLARDEPSRCRFAFAGEDWPE
jgi:hypothetical protein